MDLGTFLFQYWTEALFGVIVSLLGVTYRLLLKKIKATQAEQIATKSGIQALLRDRIIAIYNHYYKLGSIPIYELENVFDLYEQYHALGGNGTVDKLVDALKQMPTEVQAINNKDRHF